MKKPWRPPSCELCTQKPTVYCDSDSAFLCSTCDARVHRANFLAARHFRIPLRSDSFVHDGRWAAHSSSSSSSSTESCVSSAESAAAGEVRKVRRKKAGCGGELSLQARAKVMAADWCGRVLRGGEREEGKMKMAMLAVKVGLRKMKGVPVRCLVAAAVWIALEKCRGGGLRRVEECSGVPAKLILAVGGKLFRLIGRCHVEEEGWAECP